MSLLARVAAPFRRVATRVRTKRLSTLQTVDGSRGWWPLIKEMFAGAWQQNAPPLDLALALKHPTVYACLTLIASDIAKCRYYLATQSADGIWTETTSPAFSPVLLHPNRYQTRPQFLEAWITSLYASGNTYVLKARDGRQVVTDLYVLDPSRVLPLVAPDGSVYYELCRDDLATLVEDRLVVPARDIIHDRINPLYHWLVGISPLAAAWGATLQGLQISDSSSAFFSNGSKPGGVLTAPGHIAQETADRLSEYWNSNFTGAAGAGKTAVLGDGLHYEAMAMSATDAQLIEQLRWTDEAICRVFHVPPYKVNVGPAPSYANVEAQDMNFYSQGLQIRVKHIESLLGQGLDLPTPYGIKFQLTDLLRMDTATKVQAARDAIGAGFMTPNEARAMFDLLPVAGGDTPYLQQQCWPLKDLVNRPLPSQPPLIDPPQLPAPDDDIDPKMFASALQRKALAAGLVAS